MTCSAAVSKSVYYELVRYATLAASSHNTQCWQFKITDNGISILPDLTRRCPVVDPDNHHLYVSLGCATENLLIAAKTYGFKSVVKLQEEENAVKAIHIHLTECAPVRSLLLKRSLSGSLLDRFMMVSH